MKKRKIVYVEPADYFPKEIREEYKLGEYAKVKETKVDEICDEQLSADSQTTAT